MDGEHTKVLLVSANVGSIFEEPTLYFGPWLKAFLHVIEQKEPGVVALHCQEVGGKNYEASMQHVNQFVKNLLACDELQKYDRARIFLDEDYTAADRFTALGNLYFIHEDIDSVLIWDFVDKKFVAVEGREVLSGNIENVPIKDKAKFPQNFFPEFKWSRKGYLRTRWSVNNCIFDLVNIHLFHDASNIVAMESSPSLYSTNRKTALTWVLDKFQNEQSSHVPMSIFGDFNFRLDSYLFIKALTAKAVPQQTLGKKDHISKVVYTEEGNGKVVLTVESKSFDCHEKHTDLFTNTIKWLLQYDTEPTFYQDRLYEYAVKFPPSYPFTEDVNDGVSYMKTRVPSWCDRILLSHSAKDIISSEPGHNVEYNIIGKETCMGDHKPVSLFLRMKPGKGKISEGMDNLSSFVFNLPDAPKRKRGLSINGESVPEPRNLKSINIHDFAVFEREQELIPEFRVSIKSRSSACCSDGFSPHNILSPRVDGWDNFLFAANARTIDKSGVARTPSFKKIAQQVRMVERVLLRWPCRPRSRHHSSSSEDFCFEDDSEVNNTETDKEGVKPDDIQFETNVDDADSASGWSSKVAKNLQSINVNSDANQNHSKNMHNESTKDIKLNDDKAISIPKSVALSDSILTNRPHLNEFSKDAALTTQSQCAATSTPPPSQSSKVVEMKNIPHTSVPNDSPGCCDRDSVVVHGDVAAASQTRPPAEQVKTKTTGSKNGEASASSGRPFRCPCVIL